MSAVKGGLLIRIEISALARSIAAVELEGVSETSFGQISLQTIIQNQRREVWSLEQKNGAEREREAVWAVYI